MSLLALERVVTSLDAAAGAAGRWLLLAVALVTVADALRRSLFGRPIQGTFEATELVLAVIIFFGLPYTGITDGHVSVDFLTSRLGPRMQYAIIAVNALVSAALLGLITLQMADLTAEYMATSRTTITVRIPIVPFILPVTVAAGLAILGFVVQAVGAGARVLRPAMPPLPPRPLASSMSELLIAVLGFAVLLVLILVRVPIAAAMAMVGVGGTAWIAGWPAALAMVKQSPFERATSYTLVVVPLFVLMGYLAARAGLSQNLFRAANVWLGHWRGGLAMATVGACAGFAAICGSSVATGATMCSVALPEMRRYRYADSLSTGSIAAGGTLGILIPPSIIFVLYGIMTEQSIGKLLLAGILPGLVLTGLFMLAIALVTAVNPALGAAGPRTTWRERLVAVRDVWEVLILFVVVIGSLYIGLATPVESAAFGAVGALLFGLGKRLLTWQGLLAVLDETVRTTAMVFFIVIGADLFGYFMALSQMPMQLAAWLSRLQAAPVAVLWAIIVTYIILGALMDELAMILLTVPIFFPVVTAVGYDPIWFGVIIVVVVQIGLIAPPVGLNVFVIGGMARDVPLATIYRGIMPFLAAQIVLLILLTLWPGLALLLPGTMQ